MPSRTSPLLIVLLAMVMIAGGCVGSIDSDATGQATASEGAATPATTTAEEPTATEGDETTGERTTTGVQPSEPVNQSNSKFTTTEKPESIPITDQRTKEVITEIREKQAAIESYGATVTEQTVEQLSNGSELRRTQKASVTVGYGANTTQYRLEWLGPDSDGRFSVQNATAVIEYVPTEDEYRVRRGGRGHGPRFPQEVARQQGFGESVGATEYSFLGYPSFEHVRRENVISYNGTDTIGGEEVYVIHFEGNQRAYYAQQTFWIDTETGVILQRRALKPHLNSMTNMSLAERRNPENNSGNPWNDSDNDPDAVYPGDKTITWTYENVSVGDVSNETFEVDYPENADIEIDS